MRKLLLTLTVSWSAFVGYSQVINTFPYSEDFESFATCGTGAGTPCTLTAPWNNAGGDNIDWTVDINGTTSSPTGPTANGGADHNPGIAGGKYLYLESSAAAGNPNAVAFLESPWFDFTALSGPQLTFWYHMFGATMGTLQVDARTGINDAWTTIDAPFTDNQDLWQERLISLTAYAGEDSLQVRWHGITGTSFTSDMAIDDIAVFEPQPVELQLTSIDSLPTSACGLGLQDVWITISELGTTGLTAGDTIFASYDDGTTMVQDTIVLTGPLASGTNYNHMFSQQADFSTPGNYTITASIFNSADASIGNDTLITSITNIIQVTSFPYMEDFESGTNGWIAKNATDGAQNGTWDFGTPNASVINTAASGDSAWATNLTGNYNNNDNSWVESPCFDMTNAVGDEQVALSVWWNSENSWDGTNITISTDGGATWALLGANGDPGNWYNDGSINGTPGGSQQGWTGSPGSNGWVVAKHSLPPAAFASTSVRFRVNFGSDGSVNGFNGVAFDDFAIASPPVFDPFPDTISICDTILGQGTDPGIWNGYLWDNGETTQFSTINTTGIHWVEVTGPYGTCARDSFYVDTFYMAIPPNLEDNRLICYPDITTIDAGTDTMNLYTYTWSTGETTSSISTGAGGTYSVIKADTSGTCTYNDTIVITVAQVDLGPSTIGYCSGAIPMLDAGPGGTTYLWNTNDTTQTITPTNPGAYSVTVIDTNGCLLIDAVNLVESIPVVDLGPDQTICVYNDITLDAGSHASYAWSDGSTNQTLNLVGSTLGLGTYNYNVTVTDSVGCTASGSMQLIIDECAGLEELSELGVSIYPNPSNGIFNYNLDKFENAHFTILDVTGKVVSEIDAENQIGEIDLTHVENGVYIIKVNINEQTHSSRLIKQ